MTGAITSPGQQRLRPDNYDDDAAFVKRVIDRFDEVGSMVRVRRLVDDSSEEPG